MIYLKFLTLFCLSSPSILSNGFGGLPVELVTLIREKKRPIVSATGPIHAL